MGHRPPQAAVEIASHAAAGRELYASLRQSSAQAEPAGGMDHEGRLAVRGGPRDSAASSLRPWLQQHRLRPLYQPPAGPERSSVGALGRTEARVRHPHPGVPEIAWPTRVTYSK